MRQLQGHPFLLSGGISVVASKTRLAGSEKGETDVSIFLEFLLVGPRWLDVPYCFQVELGNVTLSECANDFALMRATVVLSMRTVGQRFAGQGI
jgi:hypothetical protein